MREIKKQITTNDDVLNKLWIEYATIFNKGLKKQSKVNLNNLLLYIKSVDENDVELFVDCYCKAKYDNGEYIMLQFPLIEKVFLPYAIMKVHEKSTIHMRWAYLLMKEDIKFYTTIEKEFGNPFKLLLRSYELNPNDELTIKVIMNSYINDLWYGVHHMPQGVIYTRECSMALLNEVGEFVENLPSKIKESYVIEYQYYNILYREWYSYVDSNTNISFDKWCVEKGIECHFTR